MTRSLVLKVLAFTLVTFAAARIGPAIGERITRGESLPWQLLPWVLLLSIGGALFLWARRAQRRS